MSAETDLRLRPFSNGMEYAIWCDLNCDRCAHSRETWPGCPMQDALSEAYFGDGTVSVEIATRMGYSHERAAELGWRCGEFEARS